MLSEVLYTYNAWDLWSVLILSNNIHAILVNHFICFNNRQYAKKDGDHQN